MSVEQQQRSAAVIWHELECGAYGADFPVWRRLADRCGNPVLDIGAGIGRTALDLARCGHEVTALDHDPLLIAELVRRAGDLPITTVVADARQFELGRRFSLIIVPMQTIQLLGGAPARERFLACAARHLRGGGTVAMAITERLECFSLDDGIIPPTPDMRETDGILYSSQPTAVREDGRGFVLERLRERVAPDGRRNVQHDLVRFDRVSAGQLEREARSAGLRPLGRDVVLATADHVGSVVVRVGG